jgi:hypothetical protein
MPYSEKESVKPPSNWDSGIWRYISTSQFLSILENGELHFTRTDKFPDPFEGTLPEEVLEKFDRVSQEGDLPRWVEKDTEGDILMKGTFDSVKTYNKIFFHNCWNYKAYESKPMWDNKSKDGEGLAIKTSAENLKQSFNEFQRGDVYIGLMEYDNYENEVSPESHEHDEIFDWKSVHLNKPIEFEDESELRATVSLLPTPEADPFNDFSNYEPEKRIELNWDKQPSGVKIPVDEDKLIQEVRLSPYSDDWQVNVLQQLLNTYGIDASISKSKIFG